MFISPFCLQGLLAKAQRPPTPAQPGMDGFRGGEQQPTAVLSLKKGTPKGQLLSLSHPTPDAPAPHFCSGTRCEGTASPQGAQGLWFLLNLKVWDKAIPGDGQVLGQALFPTASPEKSGGALELSMLSLSPALTQLWDRTPITQGCGAAHRATPEHGAGNPRLHPGPHTRTPASLVLFYCLFQRARFWQPAALQEHKEHAAQAPVVTLPLQGAPYSPFSEWL